MRNVFQQFCHENVDGIPPDDVRACVASALNISLYDVPHFGYDGKPFYARLQAWLGAGGWEIVAVEGGPHAWGIHLAQGDSRHGGAQMVVRQGHRVIHDPDPDGAHIGTTHTSYILTPYDPARRAFTVPPLGSSIRYGSWYLEDGREIRTEDDLR